MSNYQIYKSSTNYNYILYLTGKSVGIVTTDNVVGASPAAAFAHAAFRDWQSDKDMPENSTCKDIARQLIEDNLDIQVRLCSDSHIV